MQEIINHKAKIRKKMLFRLKSQKEVVRLKKSSLIAKKFFALPQIKKAKHIMFYLSLAEEVDTSRMIEKCLEKGKHVSVPVIIQKRAAAGGKHMRPCRIFDIKNNLVRGPLGILHPKKKIRTPLNKIDLVVTPALAFDSLGHRLGRGGGYYDKFLSFLPEKIYKIGLAFKFQILKQLPFQPHDICVDKVITA